MKAALKITADAERAVAEWRAARPHRDLPALAAALVGLHAARHSGPYVAAYARLGAAADSQHAVAPAEGGLVQLRCMRGTLHAMPVELASMTHAATVDGRVSASGARLARSGHSRREIKRATQAIRDRLVDPAFSPVTFSRGFLGSAGTHAPRHLWDTGEVLGYDASGNPTRKVRGFVLADRLEHWTLRSTTDARRELARRYVRAFGPVSLRDLAWWTGWGMVQATRLVHGMRSELLDARVEGLPARLLLHAADEPLVRTAIPPPPRARVLAYEDPILEVLRSVCG